MEVWRKDTLPGFTLWEEQIAEASEGQVVVTYVLYDFDKMRFRLRLSGWGKKFDTPEFDRFLAENALTDERSKAILKGLISRTLQHYRP